jgi:hypothetical protein
MAFCARTGAEPIVVVNTETWALRDDIPGGIKEAVDWLRYCKTKNYKVKYWEIGNETDIGEQGGCPYLITDVEEYFTWYQATVQAVLGVDPNLKVGGPAVAYTGEWQAGGLLMEGLMRKCRETGERLDFLTWHVYNSDPAAHLDVLRRVKAQARRLLPGRVPELHVTEMSHSFEATSVQESAGAPHRAASLAACLLDTLDEGVDCTYCYHVWDQVFIESQFRPFFEKVEYMRRHWNEHPYRMGMFGVCGEVRPHDFVYRMLADMAGDGLAVRCAEPDLRVRAVRGAGSLSTLIVNHHPSAPRDVVSILRFRNPGDGLKLLTVRRVDASRSWTDGEQPALNNMERRYVETAGDFSFMALSPADSVTLARLEDADPQAMEREFAEMP